MSGKKLQLKPLAIQKQLLLAESELNRAQLLKEWASLKGDVQRLTGRVRTAGSLASLAAVMTVALSAWHRGSPGSNDGKSKVSWTSTLLNGARTGASLWIALKSFFR